MKPWILGLTGGIGSGKSAAAEHFASLGIHTVDADHAARWVVEPGRPALAKIVERFGDAMLLPDGQLNRAALRERIFKAEDERRWLSARLEAERAAAAPPAPATPRPTARRDGIGTSTFTVQGVGNLLVQLARCCHPVAGEPIVGYLTRSRGVTVHRRDCAAFMRLAAANPQRVLPVEWGQAGGGYEVDVVVRGIDRRWLLKDITNLIAQEDAHVLEINSDNLHDSGRVQFRLRLKVSDYGQLSNLLGKLDALPGVDHARRLG